MAKWKVYGTVTVGVTITVEAETKDEAMEQAYAEFPGISNYCGNGGINQLVVVNDSSVSLDAGYEEPKFTEAEKA